MKRVLSCGCPVVPPGVAKWRGLMPALLVCAFLLMIPINHHQPTPGAAGFGVHFVYPGGLIDVGFIAVLTLPCLFGARLLQQAILDRRAAVDAYQAQKPAHDAEVAALKAKQSVTEAALRRMVNWYDETHAGDEGTPWQVYGHFAAEQGRVLLEGGKTRTDP